MRVVVSVGGSVLAPDLRAERVREYAAVLRELSEDHGLAAVVGGGGVAREYIASARKLGANEIQLDQLGIAVTRLNARLLVAALGERAVPAPAEELEEAALALRRGEIALMGGTVPGHTTDAVATTLAEYVNADLVVYATSVPGVYDADPNEDPDAERFEELTPDELVDVIAGMERSAGASAPVDLLAAKLIQGAGLHAFVLDGSDPRRIARAVRSGEFEGTEIVPEGR